MKKFISLVLIATFSFVLVNLGLNYLQNPTLKLVSPLVKNDDEIGLNQWFPKEVLGATFNTPDITAKSAFFIDSKTGQVLFAKNPHDKLPIASLTKVMTVLIALEHHNLDDQFLVSQDAANMEPDKMELIAGERLTLKELLYGIFLISGNDAAETLAQDSVGSREEFIKLMNSKAEELGMKDSHFVNPTGLDEDSGNGYSSAYDLSILTRYLTKHYPVTVDISSTEHMVLPQTQNHQDYDMYSGINLLTTYPGVVGFKMGYTPEAGLTAITIARKNNHEVIGVILGSEDRRDETRTLLDYSFKEF